MNTQGDSDSVRVLLRCESAVSLLVAILLYDQFDGSWLLFGALLFVPDLSMLGYLGGRHIGAVCYNFVHTSVLPGLMFGAGIYLSQAIAIEVGLIWLAHIFLDRALGYGLKLKTGFTYTHLGVLALQPSQPGL